MKATLETNANPATMSSEVGLDEYRNEVQAVLNALQEAAQPERSLEEMRAAAADMAGIAEVAFPIDVRDLLDEHYSQRAVVSVKDGMTRTDFATREFDDELELSGEKLNGWFTLIEDDSGVKEMRYAFAGRDAWEAASTGAERPYAVTFHEGECRAVAMAYTRGRYREIDVRDKELTSVLVAEAFYNIFLATQRMELRTEAERIEANLDARNKLERALRGRNLGQDLGDIMGTTPNPRVEEADGISWIVPEGFSD